MNYKQFLGKTLETFYSNFEIHIDQHSLIIVVSQVKKVCTCTHLLQIYILEKELLFREIMAFVLKKCCN